MDGVKKYEIDLEFLSSFNDLLLFLSEIVVGVVSSSLLTEEPFGWREAVGSSLIVIGGVLAVVLAPKK